MFHNIDTLLSPFHSIPIVYTAQPWTPKQRSPMARNMSKPRLSGRHSSYRSTIVCGLWEGLRF